MRSILTIFSMIVLTTFCLAQEDGLKPTAKKITAEMNFDPFSGNALSINYLRFRMFASDRTAYRMGFAASVRSEEPQSDLKRSYFELNIRPGYEKHFAGTERLSPYVAAELDIAIKKSKVTNDAGGTFTEINGAWSDNGLERGFTRIGFNVIAGADFYFAKHFYVGTEFGFGLQSVSSSDIEITLAGGGTVQNNGGRTLQIGPNFNSSIRLGFVF
ncbi:MAG: hypothetical protein AB7O48_09375 [Cyclobacteriaceae bacterium]